MKLTLQLKTEGDQTRGILPHYSQVAVELEQLDRAGPNSAPVILWDAYQRLRKMHTDFVAPTPNEHTGD